MLILLLIEVSLETRENLVTVVYFCCLWPKICHLTKKYLPVISITRRFCVLERTGDRFCLPVVRQTPPPLAVLAPAQNVLNAPFRSPKNAFQTKKPLTRSGFLFERTGDRTLDPQIKSLLLYQLS